MLLYNTGFFSTSGKINSVLLVFHRMIVSFSLLSCELNPPLLFVLKHGIYWARAIKCDLTIQHHLVSHTTLCAWPYGKGLQKVHGKYILWKWKNLLMDFKEFFFFALKWTYLFEISLYFHQATANWNHCSLHLLSIHNVTGMASALMHQFKPWDSHYV